MALPYLQTLNATARIAYPFIQKGVRAGLSGNQIGRLMQEAGIPLRRATMQEIVRREREVWQHGLNMRFLPLDRAPNPARLPEALTRLRRNYSYRFIVAGVLSDTGETFEQTRTVASSKLLTRRQATEALQAMLEDDPSKYPWEVTKITLDNVLRAGDPGTLL